MADINVEELLKKLTLSDKVDLLSGKSFGLSMVSCGANEKPTLTGIDMWHTKAIPKHGIPSVRTSDGPNGVRGTKFFNGVKAACFPCGTGLGATL